MDEREALHRLAFGGTLVFSIPRDDFAKLMDFVARIETVSGEENFEALDSDEVRELSRIASELNQQADSQSFA